MGFLFTDCFRAGYAKLLWDGVRGGFAKQKQVLCEERWGDNSVIGVFVVCPADLLPLTPPNNVCTPHTHTHTHKTVVLWGT